jgi:hypothetical protein
MRRALAAVPLFVAAPIVRVFTPALVTLVVGHVGQHRFVGIRALVGLSVVRLAHCSSVPSPLGVL